jgi:hypothetical protein
MQKTIFIYEFSAVQNKFSKECFRVRCVNELQVTSIGLVTVSLCQSGVTQIILAESYNIICMQELC